LADRIAFDGVVPDGAAGTYDVGRYSPPCFTFSRARKEGDSGPRPPRRAIGPDGYGRRNLPSEVRGSPQLGTLLAVRAALFFPALHDLHAPWLAELLPGEEGAFGLFEIDELRRLSVRSAVVRNLLCQSMYGACLTKRTEFRVSVRMQNLVLSCSQVIRWWRVPPAGRVHLTPHPRCGAGSLHHG